jgi:hypothetical protein
VQISEKLCKSGLGGIDVGENQGKPAGNVVSLDAVRQRRAFIALAHADEHWCQTRASFALSGIELTDDDAERAGHLLAGVISLEEVYAEIQCAAGLREV